MPEPAHVAGNHRSCLSGMTPTLAGGHTAGEHNLFDRMSNGLSAVDPVTHLLNGTV